MTRSTFLGANVGDLYPSLGDALCRCCDIICFPAACGRCAKCVERDASVCPCGVHVYRDERDASGRCGECAESAEEAA